MDAAGVAATTGLPCGSRRASQHPRRSFSDTLV